MSTASLPDPMVQLRPFWGAMLVLGIVLLALGLAAIGAETVATKAAITLLGAVMVAGGICEVGLSLASLRHGGGGFVLHLLSGVLSAVLGGMILSHPLAAAAGLTLILAAGWLISGVFRLFAAVVLQFPNWGFAALSALATAVLGGMVWAQWPGDTPWVIGMLVGIELIFRGANWISLALMLRAMPERPE
jgi:uncharacterized membrane protein HdeD (DUF308 family)